MGLIRAGLNAAGGVLADQWKEFFQCDAMDADVLAVKGRRVSKRGGNKRNDNVISTNLVVLTVEEPCCFRECTG